jgi:hypothetical protein
MGLPGRCFFNEHRGYLTARFSLVAAVPLPSGSHSNPHWRYTGNDLHDTPRHCLHRRGSYPCSFLNASIHEVRFSGTLCRWRFPEKAAASRQFRFTVSVCQKPVMANTHKSFRHHMHQKPSYELHKTKRHRLSSVVISIVFPCEGDHAILEADDTMVGYGNAMRVLPQVLHHRLRGCKGRFDVDHPPLAVQFTFNKRQGTSQSGERNSIIPHEHMSPGSYFEKQ